MQTNYYHQIEVVTWNDKIVCKYLVLDEIAWSYTTVSKLFALGILDII